MDNSSPINKNNGIIVELDAILDTRLSLLFTINPDLAKDVITHGYKTRDEDIFPGITKDEFVKLYEERTKTILVNATVTKNIRLINEFIIEIIKNTVTTPVNSNPVIYLNTYPYILSESERRSMVNGLAAATNGLATIEPIFASYSDMTPAYIKDKAGLVFMYEYHKWIQANMEVLKVDPSPGLGLIGPSMYFGDKPDATKIASITKEFGGVFKAIEDMSEPVIGLQLMPVEYFSINY